MKTVFQHLMEQKDKCETRGRKAKDRFLRTFYAHAAYGFAMKARNLPFEESNKPYKKS